MKKLLFFFTTLTLSWHAFSQSVLFVDKNNSKPDPDGLSWATAYPGLQMAADSAVSGDTILIREGNYFQSVNINNKELHIYGGFSGTESFARESNPDLYPTVFDGDINHDDAQGNTNDNLSYFIQAYFVYGEMTISGITFQNGYNRTGWAKRGGAIVIREGMASSGGSIYRIRNCTFIGNHAEEGGAIYTGSTLNGNMVSTYIDKCTFTNNESSSRGGAIFNYGYGGVNSVSNAYITNCIFSGNSDNNVSGKNAVVYTASSGASGGAVTNTYILNSTFYDNNGGAVLLWNAGNSASSVCRLRFHNNIVWNPNGTQEHIFVGSTATDTNNYDARITNNTISGGSAAVVEEVADSVIVSNILSTDPQFSGVTSSNFRLKSTSPCINQGDTTGYSELYTDLMDREGRNRIVNGAIDFGALEYYVTGTTSTEEEISRLPIRVYPNPAVHTLFIDNAPPGEIRLCTMQGEVVATGTPMQSCSTLDISELAAGVYILRLGSVTRKVILR